LFSTYIKRQLLHRFFSGFVNNSPTRPKNHNPPERTGEVRWKTILICTHYSNLSDAILYGLRKILPEYRRKNEVEIAATPYKAGKITLREAAANMDAPVRKTLEALGGRGVYLRYGMEEPGRGSRMITVSDSTPLIHFGTIKRPHLLRSMYGQILITEAVHREVVTEGIDPGRMDANLFGKGDYGNGLTEAKFRLLSGFG